MTNRSVHTAMATSLFIHCITMVSCILGTVIALVLSYLGWLAPNWLWLIPLISQTTSLLLGSLLTVTVGRRIVGFVDRINQALHQIAKGNYDVTLEDKPPVQELREIIDNFNTMTRELKQTELLRSDFVTNVSHEFKTPLAAIEGYATLLQQPHVTDDARTRYAEKIVVSARRLNGLCMNILLLSRLDHETAPVSMGDFSLDEQLRECILQQAPVWNDKQITVAAELEPCVCTGNQELLAQVWQNIFGNAVKFTPAGGAVSVTLETTGNKVRVTVTDNGPGMTEEVCQRAFEKFYQGDRSRAVQGNGLGLALAKQIVDLHGGTIEITSHPGAGSSFAVTIPKKADL